MVCNWVQFRYEPAYAENGEAKIGIGESETLKNLPEVYKL